jgi:hypothetical protein
MKKKDKLKYGGWCMYKLRRGIFFTLFLLICSSVFASGIPDRDRQSFGSIQLKIVNLTNETINFYFDRLYIPREIKSQEEYITMKRLVSHGNSIPISIGFPGFIGIQYENNDDIIVYSFHYRILEITYSINYQYIVVVKDKSIDFIEGNVDDVFDYFDESLYQKEPNLDWQKERLGENYIHFNFTNNSRTSKGIHIYTIVEERQRFTIRSNESNAYIIDDRLFSLGGMRIVILMHGEVFENIYLTNSTRKYNGGITYTGYDKYFNINIIINDDGYCISYE